jgi:osmoprotectant transport system permease protein
MNATRARPPLAKFLVTPALVAAIELGVYLYLTNTRVGSPIRQIIEQNLLNSGVVRTKLIEHLELVGISFVLTLLIGLPLSVLLFMGGRVPRVLMLALAGLGQAVPSIALLVLVSTYLGLGRAPAVIALVAYALLPVLRNTLVGLEGVDPAAVEAATGMGMTRLQTLLRVQIPLASPVIMAGLRTALVLIIGTATLGNFIGAGGLGDIIGEGIPAAVIGPRIVLAGAAMAAGLALLADWAMSLVAYVVVPRT